MVYHIEGGTKAEGLDNRMLRKIFGPKRDEVRGEWRKLHNEELYEIYFSSNIIRVSKSRRGVWHVRLTGEVHTRV